MIIQMTRHRFSCRSRVMVCLVSDQRGVSNLKCNRLSWSVRFHAYWGRARVVPMLWRLWMASLSRARIWIVSLGITWCCLSHQWGARVWRGNWEGQRIHIRCHARTYGASSLACGASLRRRLRFPYSCPSRNTPESTWAIQSLVPSTNRNHLPDIAMQSALCSLSSSTPSVKDNSFCKLII